MSETIYIISNRTYNYDTGKFHNRSKSSDRGFNLYSTTDGENFNRFNNTKSKSLLCSNKMNYVFYIHDTIQDIYTCIQQVLKFKNHRIYNYRKSLLPTLTIPIIWPCSEDELENKNRAEDSGFHLFKFMNNILDKASEGSHYYLIASGVGACVYRNCVRYLSRVSKFKFEGIYLIEPDIANTSLDMTHEGRYMVGTSKEIVVYYSKDSKIYTNGNFQNRMAIWGISNIYNTEGVVSQVDCTNISRSIEGIQFDRLCNQPAVYDDILSCMMCLVNNRRDFYSNRSFLLKSNSQI